MSNVRSEHAAYSELQATARVVHAPKIGATFHKPAPQRITIRKPRPIIARLYAILIGANL